QAALTYHGIVTLWQARDEVMGVSGARCRLKRDLIGVRAGKSQVFGYGRVEQIGVLAHECKQGPQLRQGHVPGITAADEQASLLGVEGAQEQVEDRRLASPRRPN